jgi:hypothetical protein
MVTKSGRFGVSGITAGSVLIGKLSVVGTPLLSVGSATGNGVGGDMVSIPTSKVLHPATRKEKLASNKNNNLDKPHIFISETFNYLIEYNSIEFPLVGIYQRDVTQKSLSCHRLVTWVD